MTQRFCRICGGWHNLDDWPQSCAGHFHPSSAGIQIIKDIEPYKAIAGDLGGKAPVIGSRREHREFLKRNGYVEIGNEKQEVKPQPIDTVSGRDIKQVMDQLRGRR